jgi:hypothetical protein
MTSNGRLIAAVIGVVVAFALPKRVECGYPGGTCERIVDRHACHSYELEPFGFYLLENVFGRNVGFAYSSGDDC